MEPGIYKDLSMEKYHADTAISKSVLFEFYEAVTPLHFVKRKPKTGDQFNMGTMVHSAILEPDDYQETIAVPPKDVLAKNGARSGNAWKEWKSEQDNAGKIVLTPDQKSNLDHVVENVFNNPKNIEAMELLTSGVSEVSFFWESESGHMAKCRPDHLPGNKIITDLKTTELQAGAHLFRKLFSDKKYIWSDIWTCRGVSAATNEFHFDYRFVVVEVNEPWEVIVYKADSMQVEKAARQLDIVEEKLVSCIKSGVWPGYDPGTHIMELTPFTERQLEKEVMEYYGE